MYLCPVCGFNGLEDPPKDFTICPSCGTEFGYDDAFRSHETLLLNWMLGGAKWWSTVDQPPANWSASRQLVGLREAQMAQIIKTATEALNRSNEATGGGIIHSNRNTQNFHAPIDDLVFIYQRKIPRSQRNTMFGENSSQLSGLAHGLAS
jgi:hypothetical protein